MFEREQIQPFPRLQTRTRQEKKPLLHVKLDDQKEEAEHWDGPIRHNFMHDWPIYSQNREVVKVTRLNQKWMATGRKSILCCNCSHVDCDVSEYKENKNKHRKHVCFFLFIYQVTLDLFKKFYPSKSKLKTQRAQLHQTWWQWFIVKQLWTNCC